MASAEQLIIEGYRQAVTTIVTACDEQGNTYVLLGRPDPRYRDREGKCLQGEKLAVGPYQFIGGQIDTSMAKRLIPTLATSNVIDRLDNRVRGAALRELMEEASFDPALISENASLDYVGDVKREGRYANQQIHYLRLHLGTFSKDRLHHVAESFAPTDDMIMTSFIGIHHIRKDAAGRLAIKPADGVTKIKTDFAGFPELAAWDASYETALVAAVGDAATEAAIKKEQQVYHAIHDTIRGLQGVDEGSLALDVNVSMYTPPDVKVFSDEKMLEFALGDRAVDIGTPDEIPFDLSRRFMFITDNPRKIREYKQQFSQYGVGVATMPWEDDQDALLAQIKSTLFDPSQPKESQKGKPRFVLNEWSDLYNAETGEMSTRSTDKEAVYNQSNLVVYYLDEKGELQTENYQARVDGYLDLSRRETQKTGVFNWDDKFVNSNTGLTYHESEPRWGKCSARHLVMSDFIQRHLFYDQRKELNFGIKTQEETIDFAHSVAEDVAVDPLIQGNRHLSEWGLDRFIAHMLNDGVHARAAINRREKTYHAPGLNAGVTNVAKPDPIHEGVYRFHDYMHQFVANITDLVPTGNFSAANKKVYHSARMMSEAMTLIMADMLFVDGLKKSGIEYDYTRRLVHPLYEALDIPGSTTQEQLANLLWASINYTLLADDSLFRAMLKPGEESAQALETFMAPYSRFFVGDHRWTDANFDNMAKQAEVFRSWHSLVGEELFMRAKLTTMDGLTKRVEDKGTDMESYAAIVRAVFDEVMQSHILPCLTQPPENTSTVERTSNAFRRWMIGQAAFYARYSDVADVHERGEAMMATLRSKEHFSAEDIAALRKQFAEDVDVVHKAQVITHDDQRIFEQIYPIFPPFYLPAYARESNDIKGTVERIFGPLPEAKVALPETISPSTTMHRGDARIEGGPETELDRRMG
ncbi:MAG: hypothetical protein SFW64_02295 [Alphaproteobacteria bacterium]|nr:hypothetical protein [Alphaproteobacteria bacterium]